MYVKLIDRVMELLLDGKSEVLETLKHQYENSKIVEVEETGKGIFVRFEITRDSRPVNSKNKKDFNFGDVNGIVDGIVGAIGFILYVRNGYISTLEGYANVPGSWSNVNEDTQLIYMSEKRNLEMLEKMEQ